MNRLSTRLAILGVLAWACVAAAQLAEVDEARIYVPYRDLAAVVDPAGRAVLMDRKTFAGLLAAAEANAATDTLELGQVTAAEYQAEVTGANATLTGTLTVQSLSDKPVRVPLHFAGLGLTRVLLDGKPAPLGRDAKGRLVLVVTGRGKHELTVAASDVLTELPAGGMVLAMSLPAAVAGKMTLAAPGDLELHANVPVASAGYDRQADRTTAELALGGHGSLRVVLLGNGRLEDRAAILLGESAETVTLTKSHQVLRCAYTVQILGRGMRELVFDLPAGWTVTDVTSPDLVRWSVAAPEGQGPQGLHVRLRVAGRGARTLHIAATAPHAGTAWNSPFVALRGAAFQRGYLLVDAGEELRCRAETLTRARREDVSAAAAAARMLAPSGLAPPGLAVGGGRLYYHWGRQWAVRLDLATIALRRSSDDRQRLTVTPEELRCDAEFRVTAVGRELYDAVFVLPPARLGWDVHSVTVNGRTAGFEYRVSESAGRRTLTVELARPVRVEGEVKVAVSLRHVPPSWRWSADSPQREVAVPLIVPQAEAVSGLVSVSGRGDLDAAVVSAPQACKPVTVGRMSLLGLSGDVQAAYTYESPPVGAVRLRVTRRRPRLSASSVGLVTAAPTNLTGQWLLTYTVSRAHTRKLHLLADKSLGENLKIETPKRRLASKRVVAPGEQTVPLPQAVAKAYDLWQLTLDDQAIGEVAVRVRYDRPLPPKRFDAPLIRPAGAAQVSEVLAVQASEELALSLTGRGVSTIDTVDLPPLPGEARRLLAAFRLAPPGRAEPAGAVPAAVTLETTVHENYAVPPALVLSAKLNTYLGARGEQRTDAVFRVVNAGVQFLAIRLPHGAELWSVRVGDRQAKPKRSPSGDYLVPLSCSSAAQRVRVVYGWAGPAEGAVDRVRIGGVTLPGVRTNQVQWTVHPPPGYRITAQETRMQTADMPRPTPAYARIIDVLGVICGGPLLMPTLSRSRELSRRATAASNLHTIGRAIAMYRADNNSRYPDSLDELVDTGLVPPEALLDPNDRRVAYSRPTGEPDGQVVIACTSAVNGRVSVLHADGSVGTGGERYGHTGVIVDGFAAPRSGKSLTLGVGVLPAAGERGRRAPPAQPAATRPARQAGAAAAARPRLARGRYTLPVELVPAPSSGAVRFTALGQGELVVGLTGTATMSHWWSLGAALIAAAGVALLRATRRRKAALVVAVLAGASLLAVWWPASTHFANGAFLAALCLVPLYLLVGLIRWAGGKLRRRGSGAPAPAAAAVLAAMLLLTAPASAAAPRQPAPPVVIPYDGDPAAAEKSQKVLIPYGRFVRLWNLAHPDRPIEAPAPGTDVALADARYAAIVAGERMTLTLTAEVRTFGRGWVRLPMPISGLAVTEATFDGRPARLQVAPAPPQARARPAQAPAAPRPAAMVLSLPGGAAGTLRLTAVTTPKVLGRTGSVDLSLPPLPQAVMTVRLPAPDLVLDAPGAEGVLRSRAVPGGVEWTLPVADGGKVSLRWSPKAGGGAVDRTLTASGQHDVHFHHWAVRGASKLTYTFSAGERSRFGILLPAGVTVTGLTGANFRDFRVVADQQVDGRTFKVLEVRLHRPAARRQELTLHWLSDLPALDKPVRLLLPRPAGVGRDSGTVTLHAAGGMALKIAGVSGGRRGDVAAAAPKAPPAAGQTRPVARYYWPYRPFALDVELSRPATAGKTALDQLVRISTERIQLLVQADLSARRGRLFDCHFALPDGYELLSVVGPAVGDHYVQPAPDGRRLHVNFSSGVAKTRVALVLVRDDPALGVVRVPMVSMISPAGRPVADQGGRLAVQVAPALEAHTAASENLKPIKPSAAAAGWLDARQVRAVQFAYDYDRPPVVLSLDVRPQPTKVRVEVFTGLTVQPTSAWYTVRLRYTVEGSPIDRVSFTLPSEYAPLVAVASPSLRSVATADAGGGRTRWDVSLLNEVTGLLDLTVNFALPIDAGTRELPVPRVVTEAAGGYRAIVAVQNDSRHDLSVADSANLTPLPVGEQRKLLAERVRASLQYVFQSFAEDWTCRLKLTPAKVAKRIQAVVDLLAVTTVIDRGGRCRCEARVSLQNRSEQFLRVKVPQALELWSAVVAGEAVRPVTPAAGGPSAPAAGGAGASKGPPTGREVLIPLVKTDPGGLPYDVTLYFAGRGLTPLDHLTRLRPPGIAIVGVPVMRTTWSLRLPGGYRYVRPAGNMSPVAGAAERMTVVLEARLGQLKRLEKTYSDLPSFYFSRAKKIARYNWDAFNKKVSAEIRQTQRYLDANREEISRDDYHRLKVKVQKQYEDQTALVASQEKRQRSEKARLDYNVNAWLNREATNPGLAEHVRGKTLNTVPTFVQKTSEAQRRELRRQLEMSQVVAGEEAREPKADAGRVAADRRRGGRPSQPGQLGQPGMPGQPGQPGMPPQAAQPSESGQKQRERRQSKLQSQLDTLTESRAERYFLRAQTAGGGKAAAGMKRHIGSAQVVTSGRPWGQMEDTTVSRPRPPADKPVMVPAAGLVGGAIVAPPGGLPHVARGTFSLPVALPGGDVRLDFARPGGEAELSVWAVRTPAIHALYGTGAIIAAVVLASLALKLLGRIKPPAGGVPPGFIAGYLLLALMFVAIAGILGLAVCVAIVLVTELVRRRAARRRRAQSAL